MNNEEKIINTDLDSFLEYLKYQKNYSEYTILNYHNDIVEYIAILSDGSECKFQKVVVGRK